LQALQAAQHEVEELRSQTEGFRLEHERAAHKRKEKIAKLEEEIPDHQSAIAAAEVRKRALEIGRPILNLRLIGGWRDFAMELRAIFCTELDQETRRAPRFIAAVTPDVTAVTTNAVGKSVGGKTVRIDTVKHFVNRHI
jgi:hypothetical protein